MSRALNLLVDWLSHFVFTQEGFAPNVSAHKRQYLKEGNFDPASIAEIYLSENPNDSENDLMLRFRLILRFLKTDGSDPGRVIERTPLYDGKIRSDCIFNTSLVRQC